MTFVCRRPDRWRPPRVSLHMLLRAAAAACCLVMASLAAEQRPLPEPQAFLQQARTRLQTDDERQRGYMYVESRRDQKLDKNGRPTSETVKVFESYPGLPGEDRWDRILSENASRLQRPSSTSSTTIAARRPKSTRRKSPAIPRASAPAWRANAPRSARAQRKHRRCLCVFELRMVGREPIEGHDTIVFTMTPRPDAKPRTRAGG